MKKLVGLFIATLGVIAIASCNKEPDPSLEIGVDADVVVESPSATYTFTFTTNQSWTAESDSDWLTLEVTSGQAGDIALVASFTANNTNDYRYAKVSIKAGSLAEEYTLAQKPVVKSAENVRLGKAAQDIEIPVNKDADAVVVALDSDWLTKNESASTNSKLVLSATANESFFAREVVATVTNNGKITEYTVRQNGNAIDLKLNRIVYLGRKSLAYDDMNGYRSFDEFAFVCVSEENKKVVLTVNAEKIEGEVKSVPAGTYVIDADGSHVTGTFSTEKNVEYFTYTEDLDQINEGEIVVEYSDGVYSVIATLTESAEKAKTYSFTGSVETIDDESLGIQTYSLKYLGQYDTWFTPTQAKKWDMQLVFSANYDKTIPYLTWVTLTLFGASTQEPSELPTGTFTIVDGADVPKIDSPYVEGITDYQPNTLTISGNDDEYRSFFATSGGTVTITKQDDGKYSFAFDAEINIVNRDPDDWSIIIDTITFNYKPVVENVVVPEVAINEEKPLLDGDGVIGTPNSNYLNAYWHAQALGDDYDAFWLGFDYLGGWGAHYNLRFGVTVANDKYEFEQYNSTSYSRTTYVPLGTYSFSWTPGDGTLVPLTTNSYIENSYTGTKYYITGGSVTFAADVVGYAKQGTITYNLKATPGTVAKNDTTGEYIFTPTGDEATFTGSHTIVFYRVTNRSTNALALYKLAQ